MADPSSGLFAQLRERRVPQFFGAYAAGGWVILQIVDQLINHSLIGERAYPLALVTYLVGVPAVLVLAWFHGKPGRQRLRRFEHFALASIALVWLVVVGVVARRTPSRLPARAEVTAARATQAAIGGSFLIPPFRNLTGSESNDWLIEGSVSLLADVLGQWREVSVVPPERMYAALRRRDQRPGEPVGLDVLAKMAEETGSRSIVSGEVLRNGEQLLVSARVYDAQTGAVLVEAKEPVSVAEDVRVAYERLAVRLLQASGLPVGTAGLRSVTTQSLEAYKAYARGIAHQQREELRRAEGAFREAVRLDSTFAQAWARLAFVSMRRFEDLMDPRSPAYSYAARAAELSVRLPERQRKLVQVIQSLYQGQFAAARQELEALVAADSTDVEALEALINLEVSDWILVPVGRSTRPRGSLNRAVALAERVLRLDPSRHAMYNLIATIYTRIAEPRPSRVTPPSAIVSGYEKEAGSLTEQFGTLPKHSFRAILRDTIELVRIDSLTRVHPDSLAASQKRARTKAKVWVDRWLTVGPEEAVAHLAASRLAELEQNIAAASGAQRAAETLAAADEHMAVPIRRVALLGRQRRYQEALTIADSLRRAGHFDNLSQLEFATPSDGFGWAYALYLMRGDSAGVSAILRGFATVTYALIPVLVNAGIMEAPKTAADSAQTAQLLAVSLLTSSKEGDITQGQMASPAAPPFEVLLEAIDSLVARPALVARAPLLQLILPGTVAYATFAADSLAARRTAARVVELALTLGSDSSTVSTAQRLARVAVRVDASLRARVANTSWYEDPKQIPNP